MAKYKVILEGWFRDSFGIEAPNGDVAEMNAIKLLRDNACLVVSKCLVSREDEKQWYIVTAKNVLDGSTYAQSINAYSEDEAAKVFFESNALPGNDFSVIVVEHKKAKLNT